MRAPGAPPVRLGVIGTGGMGSLHARNAAFRIPGAAVAALADLDEARLGEVAAGLGVARTYSQPLDLIADPEVEAVVVATPAATHAGLIGSCAAAGKHVFCEKPIAVTLAEAVGAAAAVERAPVSVQVGFNRRYDAPYVAARQRIEAGVIGEPLVFKSITRDRTLPPRSYLEAPGSPGMLIDTGVHDFDLARWLMGDEVGRVQTMAAHRPSLPTHLTSGPTATCVNLAFRGGAIGSVETLWAAAYGDDVRTEVVGSLGTLLIGTAARLPLRVMTEAGLAQEGYPDHFDRFGDSYLLELAAFVAAVRSGGPITSTLEDGIRALEIAVAARRSAEQGMAPIDLPLDPQPAGRWA